MTFEQQAEMYSHYIREYAPRAVYVASGNESSTALFTQIISPTPVVTKTSLLSGADLEQLNNMSWDQQAEVDYLVMMRASIFLGMSDSSFSFAAALARRAQQTREGTCGLWRNGFAETSPREGVALGDELSVIVGKPNPFHFGPRLWP